MDKQCRHGSYIEEEDCLNCENDDIQFEKWWGDRLSKDDPQYAFAKSAWDAAIKYMEDDFTNSGFVDPF